MKIRDFLLLNEEKMNTKDISIIKGFVSNPKNGKFVLKSFSKEYDDSEREVVIKKTPKGVKFEYNSDIFKLTSILVDICDSEGYKFKSNGNIFEVIK